MMKTLGTSSVEALISVGSRTLTTLRRQRYQSMYVSPYIMVSCGGCLPKYPFDDNWFGDAITEVGALSELVWAPPALILDTYQCYDEGVQNSVNGSRNH